MLKEEYRIKDDGTIDVYSDRAERDKKFAEHKEQIASGKLKVRDLDKNPIRRSALKRDTKYSVSEIAKYCYEHSTKLQGKFESAKQLEDHLRASEKDRKYCDKKMSEKLSSKKKENDVKVNIAELINKAFKSNNAQVKALVQDFPNPTALRKALETNPSWAKQLTKLLKNINEEKK